MRHNQKAKVLARLAKKSPLLVFAGLERSTESVQELAKNKFRIHQCASCGTEVAFGTDVKGLSPFCPTCGDHELHAVDHVEVEPIPVDGYNEDSLSVAVCPSCHSHNVFDDRVMAGLKGHAHCSCCGTNLIQASLDENDDNIYSVEANDDVSDDDVLDVDETEVEANVEGEDDEVETEDLEDDEEVEEASFRKRPKQRFSRNKTHAVADNTNPDLADDGTDGEVDNTNPDLNADAQPNNGLVNTNSELYAEVGDTVEVDMVDNTPQGETTVALQQGIGGEPQLMAYVDGVHVSTLDAEDAGDNADLMGKRQFREALEVEAKVKGHKALASYGFKPVIAKIAIAHLVNAKVAREVKKQTASVVSDKEEIRADMEQSLRIAVAALNKNFYRNRPNPIATTLTASLKAMGVKGADAIVARAIQVAGEQFTNEALDLADEISNKSLDMRNELADTLSDVNPDSAVTESGEDTDVDDAVTPEEVVARAAGGGRVKAKKAERSAETVTASCDDLNIDALVSQARATR